MRAVRHPGPPDALRAVAVACVALPVDVTLPVGTRLLDALAPLLAVAESACLTLSGGEFGPFGYVIPACCADGTRAAFYSDTRRPPGLTRLDQAAVTLGWRDGRPFVHCHALWTTADGLAGCGHVLPDETVIAAPVHATGVGLVGARFDVAPDEETGFSLFKPRPTGTPWPPHAQRAVALRLAPGEDLVAAVAAAAAPYRRSIVRRVGPPVNDKYRSKPGIRPASR